MHYQKIRAWIALATLAALGAQVGLASATAADVAAAKATVATGEAVFARVNGGLISAELYDVELARAFRSKFYHGKPPEAQLVQLRREVGDTRCAGV